ncbi:MAG TPA: PEGA domain-containing protein, partial [Patescibacteria group bacterium]|nr:PEGA domain-containing protein [Patescibacteria group bacterium]
MTSIKRKILFLSFVVAFFLITTVVMFYAQGYKINLTWPPNLNQTLQRNGMLLVETEPKGATILLDGQTPKNIWQNMFHNEKNIQTPANIKGIKPGEYTLNLVLDGYHIWERKINIHPGRITTISDLRLLKKNLPLKIS